MTLKPYFIAAAALMVAALAFTEGPASAGGYGGGDHGGMGGHICYHPITIDKSVNIYKPINIYKPVNIYKPINIYKPVNITKNINIYKPVTINKNIDINKNINIDKNINITKNINNSKNININKTIIINKGGSASAEASAFAFAAANAQASASAVSYGSSSYVSIQTHNNVGGELQQMSVTTPCEMQEASVVKSIHAVCVDSSGREFPASHMIPETWIDSSYEGEIARCIAGSRVKAMVGDVLQSDHGMAGTYEHGELLACGPGDALVHYRNGMLKCAPAKPVKDCTERTNLRQWGSGDMFFAYRAQVCVAPAREAAASAQDVSGMSLEGGVGDSDSGY